MELRTKKAYGVARVGWGGIELIQTHPPMTMDQAMEVYEQMQYAFQMNFYAVVNIDTILNKDTDK